MPSDTESFESLSADEEVPMKSSGSQTWSWGLKRVHIFIFALALHSLFKCSTHHQASSGIYVLIYDAIFDMILLLSHPTQAHASIYPMLS